MKLFSKIFLLPLFLVGMFVSVSFADVTGTAAIAQGVLASAIPLLQQLAAIPLTTVGIVLAALLVLAWVLEHGLEHFVMDHIPATAPTWLKPLIPYGVAMLGTFIANLQSGMDLKAAAFAVVTGFMASKLHDSPLGTTSPAAETKP